LDDKLTKILNIWIIHKPNMVKIKEIVNQNPWWTYGEEFANYDKHLLEAGKSPIFFERGEIGIKKGNIYIIRGCRQAGKTTYLKEKVRKLIGKVNPRHVLYLSLDFFASRRELRNAVSYFLDSNREAEELYIFFDEITSIADWNLELKYLADSGITKKAPVVATGSSATSLKTRGELLPGRGLEGNEYYFRPLCFRDFVLQVSNYIQANTPSSEFSHALINLRKTLEAVSLDLDSFDIKIKEKADILASFKKELEHLLGIYLITGGFPRVINDYLTRKYKEGKEELNPLLAEVFVRDVLGDLARQNKQETLSRQILKSIIDKYGSRYSFSTLARSIESTHATVMDYLDLLEQSFILSVLYSYDFSKKDLRFKGTKKVYFLDPFIFHSLKSYLTGRGLWNTITENMGDEEILSKLIEAITCSHLAGSREIPYLKDSKTFLWFYYDARGKEIDFVLKDEGYLGIEVKYKKVDLKKVTKVQQVNRYIVLSKEELYEEGDTLVIPVEIFLSLLKPSKRNL
jgi:hypothetical protein